MSKPKGLIDERLIDVTKLNEKIKNDVLYGKTKLLVQIEPIETETISAHNMDNMARMWSVDADHVKSNLSVMSGVSYGAIDIYSKEIDQAFRDWESFDPDKARSDLMIFLEKLKEIENDSEIRFQRSQALAYEDLYSGGLGYDEDKAKEILNIPEDMRLITLVCVGKKSEKINPLLNEKMVELEKVRPSRHPFDTFAFLNTYTPNKS